MKIARNIILCALIGFATFMSARFETEYSIKKDMYGKLTYDLSLTRDELFDLKSRMSETANKNFFNENHNDPSDNDLIEAYSSFLAKLEETAKLEPPEDKEHKVTISGAELGVSSYVRRAFYNEHIIKRLQQSTQPQH